MRLLTTTFIICFLASALIARSQPDSLLHQANEHYIQADYDRAAELYQSLVDSGYHNAELYYNLGNAYFQLGKIPYAILSYERAYRQKPNDEDILFNLEFARTYTVDRIEPLPVFFLTKWYRGVRNLFTSNGWARIGIIFFGLLLSLALIFWFARRAWVKRISFAFGILVLLITTMAMIFSAQQKRNENLHNFAIIFQQVVSVKSSPNETGKDLFILHSGTKVEITKALGQWVEIRIADGNKGWLPSESLELI
jgi:tetratricopeptide (TPR) repeat protein